MEFRLLDKIELLQVYKTRMMEDFPAAELKPYEAITGMMDEGCYEAISVEKDNRAIGYALMTMVPETDYLLLDYLAVYKEYRAGGLGSEILAKLKEYYAGKTIYIESENPDFQEGVAKDTAVKRLRFYEKNGAVNSGVLTSIWTVPYVNFYLSTNTFSSEECTKALSRIYETMIKSESTRAKMIEIPQKV